jgi:hypothetical protein
MIAEGIWSDLISHLLLHEAGAVDACEQTTLLVMMSCTLVRPTTPPGELSRGL